MKTNLHKILLTGLFGIFLSAGASAETRTNKIMDKQSVIDSIVKPEKNLVIEREVTPKGDTIYRYKYQAVDLGPIEDKAPTILYKEEPKRALRSAMPALQSVAEKGNHYVGKIPFTEGVTPTGGKTYAIPILTAPCKGQAPQVAIAYNSQGGNGTAGYGWNVTGASAINVVGKTIHYDGQTAAVDLSKPAECAFALDGVRLVRNTGTLTQYDYETSQGFILVKKHLANGEIAYFTVAYPNGNTATFGFKNNTKTQPAYPITEMVDRNGYKINFEYTVSGNCHFLSRIAYGGRSEAEHTAEMLFNYETRKDFTTVYLSGVALAADKLLKSVVSRNKVGNTFEELCTYRLSHELKDVSQLVQIGCSSGGVEMAPLKFKCLYWPDNAPDSLRRESELTLITSYTAPTDKLKPIYVRGKFIDGRYNDGLITMPGAFSPYTVVNGPHIVSGIYAVQYGSGYPADQDILIAPGLSLYNIIRKIQTGHGFQTIQAADVNGDGVDEIVKVNFGGYSTIDTQLLITTYKCRDFDTPSTSFYVAVKGVAYDGVRFHSPMSRVYFFGDFLGSGKAQLLTISHNETFTHNYVGSWFSLIDLDEKTKISETRLFDLDFNADVFPMDVDGDGKMELCHNRGDGLDVYSYSTAKKSFVKLFDVKGINAPSKHSNIFGDLNGDGKMDIIVPPNDFSYSSNIGRHVPVWSPSTCPFCKINEPILNIVAEKCRYCNKNLKQFYSSENSYVTCRECNALLVIEPFHSKKHLRCPTHGQTVYVHTPVYVDKGNKWAVYLSTGKGFKCIEMPITNREQKDRYLLTDVNNDGCADLLCVRDTVARLFMNHNGVISTTAQSSMPVPSNMELLPINVCNPYSVSHLITIEKGKAICYKYSGNQALSNLLREVTDSYGMKHRNTYRSMTDERCPYKESNTIRTFPYYHLTAPLFLLTEDEVVNDDKPVHRRRFSYKGAVMHRTGLGFRGFEVTNVEDVVTNSFTREYHDIEKLGLTTHIETREHEVDMTYEKTAFTSDGVCNPILTRSVETNKLTGVKKETQLFYDAFNNPTRQRISFGNGNIYTESVQTYRNVTTSDRYLVGLPLAKATTSGRDGNTWTTREEYAYNAQWMPERQVTYTNGNKTSETRWTYDAHGNVTSEKSAPYNVTELLGNTYTYDAIGHNLLTKTNALGQTTTYAEYDKWGQAHRITDHKGRTTTIISDAWGKPVSTTSPDGITTTTTTAWGGKGLYTIAKTITGKPKTIVHYDALEREVRKGNMRFDGKWQFVDNAYDYKGRLAKTSLPFKGDAPTLWTTYEYDNYDRPIKQTEASGKTTTWSYAGQSVTETKEGIASTKTTDAIGELIKVEDPGGTITYTLRPDGQPSAITAPGNVVTTFEYDGFGRRTAIADPSAGKQTFTEKYDNSGICTSTATDARGKTVTTIKDKYGRTIQINRPEFNVSYTYNKDGQLEREEYSDRRAKSYSYDALGRVAHSLDDASGIDVGFTYKDGNVASIKYNSLNNPNGVEMKETYLYTNGHKTEVKFNDRQSVWKLIEENDLGQPTQIATGSLVRTYSYSNIGLPTRQTTGNVQDISYNFDVQTGNLLSRTDNRRNITETFGYDKLNRLCQIGTQQVKYADNGNVLEMPGMGVMGYDNAAKPYQVTAFTPIGNNVPTREQQITYNSFQCPDKITENGYSASFSYDAEGDRAEMTIRKGNDEVLTRQYIDARYEIDNSFTERFYLGGDAYDALAVCVNDFGVDSTYYILRDYLGNITHIINEDGTLRQELSYDAWGRLRNPDTHQLYAVGKEPKLLLDRGYTGHEYLPWFGLINMNARLYDPVLGRFLSPDPYVQMPDFTQNFNRYSYCLNNPLKYVDKDGEFWFLPAIIAFVVNYATTGITKGDWGLKNIGSSLVMSAVALVSYGVGMGITGALAKTAILSQSVIGGISAGVAGSVTGAMSSLMAGGNIGRGALIGFVSGLVGNALSGINMKSIWLEGVSNVAAGGLIGGATSLVSGGDFWSGFGTGAISATLGWALGKGADYVKDAVRRNEIQREVEKYLGLSKDVKEQQMSSPFAKAEQLEIPDMTAEKWNAIKNIYKRANAKYSVNFEKSQNFDLLQETYKFNRLHLRYNNTTKPNQASYTYHYDGTDIIMNPLRHIIFDSLYQWIVYKNK
ncbi:RHS repeat-associated core domain-containing protein [Prevotella sp. HMSC073D09]|uniref:RHS repeat-associated core domain-containing protein n=1 Tax=Prevotella sp. HMSC073D09 TaxID=1739459 RepID=UPI0009F3733C|nr:RHS repeat-associated core domain-containing protein [Prevotella sp. HMSC073D09]